MSQQDDLTGLHDAMTATLTKAMPMVATIKEYDPTTRDRIKTPAILLEAVEFAPGRLVGDGRFALKVEWAAHCCLSVKTERVELEIRNFAARLMKQIHRARWGMEDGVVDLPEEIKAFPSAFKPGDKGYETWVVTWSQTIYLGAVWEDAEFLPDEVYVGEAPEIGEAHQGSYQKVTDD